MELVRKGRRIEGSAVVVSEDNADGQRIAADYFARASGGGPPGEPSHEEPMFNAVPLP